MKRKEDPYSKASELRRPSGKGLLTWVTNKNFYAISHMLLIILHQDDRPKGLLDLNLCFVCLLIMFLFTNIKEARKWEVWVRMDEILFVNFIFSFYSIVQHIFTDNNIRNLMPGQNRGLTISESWKPDQNGNVSPESWKSLKFYMSAPVLKGRISIIEF